MEKAKIKTLIELSITEEEADKYIEDFTNYKSFNEKLAYLDGLFEFEIIARLDKSDKESLRTDYFSVLTAIINQKCR